MLAKSSKLTDQSNQTKQPIEMHKKYKTRDGRPARILCTDRKNDGGKYPIVAMVTFDNSNEGCAYYTVHGLYYDDTEHELDLIEVQPWDDFKIDDPVLVSDDDKYYHPFHFAGINQDGKPLVFSCGRTSFTCIPEDVVVWKYCKKPD